MLTRQRPEAIDTFDHKQHHLGTSTRVRLVALFAAAAISSGSASFAQLPTFEVAAVKRAVSNQASPAGMFPRVLPQPGGRLMASNAPLTRLVQVAYQVEDFQVTGGPSWAASERFDIVAKAPRDDATFADMQPMLRALLAERFKLRVRIEQREMPTFALVPAREDRTPGPTLKPSRQDCAAAGARCGVAPFGARGAFGLRGTGQPVSVLVRLLSQAVGRSVLDQTGLTGLYDFELTFDPAVLAGRAAEAGVFLPPETVSPPSDSPSLATALQEQLGLKLQSQKSMVDVVVIESAEIPALD
jgi:uncharacterized protein (TIGR03435 family)